MKLPQNYLAVGEDKIAHGCRTRRSRVNRFAAYAIQKMLRLHPRHLRHLLSSYKAGGTTCRVRQSHGTTPSYAIAFTKSLTARPGDARREGQEFIKLIMQCWPIGSGGPAAMPLASGPVQQPAVTTVPHIAPPGQRVVPVQPAKRVTATTQSDQTELDPDDKRRQRHADHSGDRGANLDVEV
jgi:hypothetical protein